MKTLQINSLLNKRRSNFKSYSLQKPVYIWPLLSSNFQLQKNLGTHLICSDPNIYNVHRIMFWTDWGSSERVESAGLDGKSKSTIVTSGMFWPNAVTLDLNRQIVYILEGKLAKIISCNYDGTNQNVVFSSDGYLEQAFGLSFFANRLYWDSWKETAVFSIDLNPVGSVRSVYRRTSLGVSYNSLRFSVFIQHFLDHSYNMYK